jgi:hypothetical protein
MVPAMEGDIPKCHPEETLLTKAALFPGLPEQTPNIAEDSATWF